MTGTTVGGDCVITGGKVIWPGSTVAGDGTFVGDMVQPIVSRIMEVERIFANDLIQSLSKERKNSLSGRG
jgi:hypothetical protein